MKYCFGDDAEFVAVKHYERLQRELTEAQDKIEELVEIGLTQMDKERSLKRELAEARKHAANQRRLADLVLAHRDLLIEERDRLEKALMRFDVDWTLEEGEETTTYFTYEDQQILRNALASMKGDSHE